MPPPTNFAIPGGGDTAWIKSATAAYQKWYSQELARLQKLQQAARKTSPISPQAIKYQAQITQLKATYTRTVNNRNLLKTWWTGQGIANTAKQQQANQQPGAGGIPEAPGAADGPTAQEKANAYEELKAMFDSYDLGSLAPLILQMTQDGLDKDTISLRLQQTDQYKQRFKGNEERKKLGLGVLAPAEYIALERQYRQILESNGLPKGFYDQHDDFAGWIGQDVSPAEIQWRAETAADAANNSDQFYIQTLRDYGLGQGDLVASLLDRERALPILQKTVKASLIGAEARRNSLGLEADRAMMFAQLGVTQDAARQAYQVIGENLPAAQRLGTIYGEAFGQTDLEDELLGGSGEAASKRNRLASAERAMFSGSSGLGQRALGATVRSDY